VTPSNSSHSDAGRDPYRGVILVLLLAAILATLIATVAGSALENSVLLDVAVTLVLASGILVGVAVAQAARAKPPGRDEGLPGVTDAAQADMRIPPSVPSRSEAAAANRLLPITRLWIPLRFSGFRIVHIDRGTAAIGIAGIILVLTPTIAETPLSPLAAGIAASLCLGAAGLTAMAARYFADIDETHLPEGPWLCRGSRVMAWIFVLAAVSMSLEWAGLNRILLIPHFAVLLVDAAVCYGLLRAKVSEHEGLVTFPMNLAILSILGSRTNILESILVSTERQLGIDLRSTWALTVVRRSLEPLLIGLCVMGWLSTSLTVVGTAEQGLVERLGTPVGGQSLQPGIHLHWPWPVDHVFRIPVKRVQVVQVGHEGEEKEGPENVLWAVKHAPSEYTLLLGNGRDLITIDATVQYRVVDARAWRYNCQNPAEALRAMAYRAVMKSTVNRTLSEALSENVSVLTRQIRDSVQRDADTLGLGVKVLAFTVGGMHPPVPVAADYEAVVSAELGKGTAVVNAEAYRNELVPAAEASVLSGNNGARADAENARALAAGQAWSFRILESEYRAAPEEFKFRRRLEGLEENLSGRHFIVVDQRYLKDGGLLWLTQ